MSGTIQPDATLLGEFPDNGKPGNIVPANYRNIVASKLNVAPKRNLQTGNYTVALSDIGGVIDMSSASTQTLTIPTNATVAIPVGAWFEVCQVGTAIYDISMPAGTSILGSAATLAASTAQGTVIKFEQQAANVWVLAGSVSLTASSPSGTTIIAPGGSNIIDGTGNTWNLVGSAGAYTVTQNGSAAGVSPNTIALLWFNSTILIKSAWNAWSSWNGTKWVPAAGDPRSLGNAARAYDFIDTIGVNTHVGFGQTASQIQPLLTYLGVHHIRDDSVPATFGVTDWVTLAGNGVKICLGEAANSLASDIVGTIQHIEAGVSGSVIIAEPLNEPDANSSIATGITSLQNLFAAVRAVTPALDHVRVAAFPLATQSNASSVASQSAVCDLGNCHLYNYAALNGPTYTFVSSGLALETAHVSPGRPNIITEFSQNTASTETAFPNFGVTQDAQAKFGLAQYCDHFVLGVVRSYWYELFDFAASTGSTDFNDNFGLFTNAGTAKTAATAIQSLTTLLNDAGASAGSFVPGSLTITPTNLPTAGKTILLQKSSGVFDLIVWNDDNSWWTPGAPGHENSIAVSVTLAFSASFTTIKMYSPVLGTTAQVTASGTTITFTLNDTPLIIECTP